MLWSIIPEDTVFAGVGIYAGQGEEAEALHMEVDGCPCQLRRGRDGSFCVEAVCSTNPKDFMRREIAPGRRIFLPK